LLGISLCVQVVGRFHAVRHATLVQTLKRLGSINNQSSTIPRHFVRKNIPALTEGNQFAMAFNLSEFHNIEVLAAPHSRFSERQWQQVFSKVKTAKRLIGLVADGTNMSSTVIESMVAGLKPCPIQALSLCSCQLHDLDVPLVASLFRTHSLAYCDLSINPLSSTSIKEIISCIMDGNCLSLELLDLSSTNVGDTNAILLAKALRSGKLPKLRHLFLNSASLHHRGCIELLKGSTSIHSNIEVLELNGNNLVDQDRHKSSLLGSSKLLSSALSSLSSAVQTKKVRIRRRKQSQAVRALLQATTKVAKISLASCGIDDAFATEYSRLRDKMIKYQGVACELDLRRNAMSVRSLSTMTSIVVPPSKLL